MLSLSLPPPVLQLHIAPNKEINQDIKKNWGHGTPTLLINVEVVGVCQDFWEIDPVSWWVVAWYKLLAFPVVASNSSEDKKIKNRGAAQPRPLGIDWRPHFHSKPPGEEAHHYHYHYHYRRGGGPLSSRSEFSFRFLDPAKNCLLWHDEGLFLYLVGAAAAGRDMKCCKKWEYAQHHHQQKHQQYGLNTSYRILESKNLSWRKSLEVFQVFQNIFFGFQILCKTWVNCNLQGLFHPQ